MLVSVAIPAYNEAEYLRTAIESVLAQTYPEIEIVVVDDGSTDHTRQICEGFEGRIRYIFQENDRTFGGSARRRAILESSGDLVAILDQDDRWLPSKIEKQVRLLGQQSEFAAAFTGWRTIDAQGRIISEEFNEAPSGDVFHLLLEQNRYLASSALIRRTLLMSRLPDARITPADYYLWLAIARDHEIGFIPECLTEYRRHEKNYTQDFVNLTTILEGLLKGIVVDRTLLHSNCDKCEQAIGLGLLRARQAKAMAYFQEYCRLAKTGQFTVALSDFKRMIDTQPSFIFDLRRILAAIKSMGYGVWSLSFPKRNPA